MVKFYYTNKHPTTYTKTTTTRINALRSKMYIISIIHRIHNSIDLD